MKLSTDEVEQQHKEHFDKLGDIGTVKGRSAYGMTVGVLEILCGDDREKLAALASLCEVECFDDVKLLLKARRKRERLRLRSVA